LSRRIAFFDFDGTITDRDTLIEIFRYTYGSFRCNLGFILNSPVLIAYKLGLVSNQFAKEIMLTYFFGTMKADRFRQQCDDFARTVLPGFIRPKALEEIKKLQAAGAEVVIVSASAGDWIKAWANSLGVALIATNLEVKNDIVTGKINGRNCYGEEKIRRITNIYELSGYK